MDQAPYGIGSHSAISIRSRVSLLPFCDGGRTSIKVVLVWVERDDAHAGKQWRDLLLQYCGLDSLAMVLIWEYWERCLQH